MGDEGEARPDHLSSLTTDHCLVGRRPPRRPCPTLRLPEIIVRLILPERTNHDAVNTLCGLVYNTVVRGRLDTRRRARPTALPRRFAAHRPSRGGLARADDARREGRANQHALRLRRGPGQDHRGKNRGGAEVRRGHADPRLRPGRRILHPLQRDPARRLAATGRVPQPAPEDRRRHPAGHSAAGERGGDARPDVLRRHDLPRRPRAGQHLEHGTAGPRLRRCGQGSPLDRRPPELHPCCRANPRPTAGPQSRGLQRGSFSLRGSRRRSFARPRAATSPPRTRWSRGCVTIPARASPSAAWNAERWKFPTVA